MQSSEHSSLSTALVKRCGGGGVWGAGGDLRQADMRSGGQAGGRADSGQSDILFYSKGDRRIG